MSDLAYRLKVFRQIGLAKPQLPHRLAIAGYQLVKWGPGFPAAVAAAAARFPRQTAIIDDIGEITWAELRDQVNQLTRALQERGIEAGDSVALLARNHRYIVMSMIAIMQAGARVLLGDPVRHYLPQSGLVLLAEHDVATTRDLEGAEVKRVRVLTFG